MARLSFPICAAALLAVAAAAVPAWAQDNNIVKAGVSAAVRGDVTRANVRQVVARKIGSGEDIFLGDHVTSGADSGMQILLLDETTFTLGPQSDMVIDQFVYDPQSGAGKLAASVTKGAFRFVTGNIAGNNPSDMKVDTPAATIGIRGTMVEGRIEGGSTLVVLLGPGFDTNSSERHGQVIVSNRAGSVELDGPGYATLVRGPDSAPGEPVFLGLDELLRLDLALGTAHAGTEGGGGAVQGGAASAVSGQSSVDTGTSSVTVSTLGNVGTGVSQTVTTSTHSSKGCVPHLGTSC